MSKVPHVHVRTPVTKDYRERECVIAKFDHHVARQGKALAHLLQNTCTEGTVLCGDASDVGSMKELEEKRTQNNAGADRHSFVFLTFYYIHSPRYAPPPPHPHPRSQGSARAMPGYRF